MATPSYGDRPPLQGYRRTFTVPSRSLSLHETAGLDKADADANILYSHPSVRIVTFSPPTDSIPPQSKEISPDTDYPVDTIETLPWRSRTETLASTGGMVIEKVRGSGNFLKSTDQRVIHTIMRNSQCWCVDGESKFVLRTGKFRYYRIELPSETEVDKEKVQELKTVLNKVLRFERTPCPFKRAFHVNLPDDAMTPRRKGTWKRKQPPPPATPNTDPLPRTKNTRTWSLQGQNTPTPLPTYGRRGSDYGYNPSRGSSPLTQHDGEGYQSTTSSSLASSEDAGERRPWVGSSEGDPHQNETRSVPEEDDGSINESEHQESSAPTDDVAATDKCTTPDSAEALNSTTMVEGSSSEAAERLPAGLQAGMRASTEGDAPSIHSREDTLGETVPEDRHKKEEWQEKPEEEAPQEETIEAETSNDGVSGRNLSESNEAEEDSSAVRSFHEPPQVSKESFQTNDIDPTPYSVSVVSGEGFSKSVDKSAAGSPMPSPETLLPVDNFAKEPGTSEWNGEVAPQGDNSSVGNQDDGSLSRVSSVDSFHTTNSLTQESLQEHVDSIGSETTPNAETFGPFSTNIRQHRRELSELTVTASTIDDPSGPNADWRPLTSDSLDKPPTPGLARSLASDSSWPEVHTPSSPVQDGLRRRLRVKRSLSPLPPSATLFSPPPPNHGNHLTATILQKACTVVLVQPIEAVVWLVHILARIAGGATVNDLLSGDLFRRPEQHRRNSSFPDQVTSRDDSDEDDFGVPIRGRCRSEEAKAKTQMAKEDDADSIFDLD
ncbi:uncharacterized protein Z518_01857 [Rhinocladiella mackenziei CBS 650.93]|uniref:Inheritance of peroxisomes protein 1 n=1 Tax=Rhinocladiella mackenziei CBS 650.93 TaxID=1442369 RepID=A0A0D2IN11_9EURO|nr:uncharacterized protein Z518_01857 [Rhinocladiella mackenziei CBS 650.93]KIX07204.1 hypothetical protein Z518_01857 [Rhinocladiella mackenziei CBS 650.93]